MKKLEFNMKQVLIVLIIILLVLNGVKMIKKQKNTTISIKAIALDNYGYSKTEEFKLEAKETEDNLYEIELPETINEKVVAQTINVVLQDDTIIEMKENKIVLTKEQLQNNKLTLKVEYDTTGEEETSADTTSPTVTVNGTKVSGGESLVEGTLSIDPSTYGAYVKNYASSEYSDSDLEIGGWQLLYVDDTNIYLIADNYINNTYVPTGKDNHKSSNSKNYITILYDQSTDYNGIGDINETVRDKFLSKYMASLPLSEESKPIFYNSFSEKATAYLLDVKAWDVFADNEFADWAVGGPSLEILLDSYNAKYNIDNNSYIEVNGMNSRGFEYQMGSEQTLEDGSTYIGYRVKGGTCYYDNWETEMCMWENLKTGVQFLPYDNSENRAYYCYVASPSGYAGDSAAVYMAGATTSINGYLIWGNIIPDTMGNNIDEGEGEIYARYPPCNLYKGRIWFSLEQH